MARPRKQGKQGMNRGAYLSTIVSRGEGVQLGGWARMFAPNWLAVVEDEEIGKMDWRVLMLCALSTAETKGQKVPWSQREMAEQLKVTPQTVNESVQRLVRKGLLFQKGHALRVNSHLTSRLPIVPLLQERHQERAWLAEETP